MWIRRVLERIKRLFGRRTFHLALYGPPNGGKTTLANRICADWLGEEMGSTSEIAHETRRVFIKEGITIQTENGAKILFSLADTPGMATRIDYEDFLGFGLNDKEAKERAKEAADGVLESIGWLEKVDGVIVVLDATKEPGNQVNSVLLASLQERNIPHFVIANKIDLKSARIERVISAYPQLDVVAISAREGDNMEKFYDEVSRLIGGF